MQTHDHERGNLKSLAVISFLIAATCGLGAAAPPPGPEPASSPQAEAEPQKKGESREDQAKPATGHPGIALAEVQVKANAPAAGTVKDGYRKDEVSKLGPWDSRNLQDTPYSISIMSKELMDNLQVSEMNDIWKYCPYSEIYIPNARVADNIYLRGIFNSRRTQDGLNVSSEFQPLEDKEQVEIMTGVTGFMYGIGSPGGVVNFVTKRAPSAPLAEVTETFSGRSDRKSHVDVGAPLTANGSVGFRLNLVEEGGETYMRGQTLDKDLVSGALDFHFSPQAKLELDASHYYNKQDGMQTGFSPNAASRAAGIWMSDLSPYSFDPTKLYGQPWSFEKDGFTQGGALFTWEINDTFTFRGAIRDLSAINERLNVNATVDYTQDTYTETIYHIGLAKIYTLSSYGYLDAKFHTGPVQHQLTVGFNEDHQQNRAHPVGSYTSPATGFLTTTIGADPVYVPQPSYAINQGPFVTTYRLTDQNYIIGDDIRFSEQWRLLLGVNDAYYNTRSYSGVTGATTSQYDNHKATPTWSLMYKPVPAVTTYVSYLEALESGGTAPASYNGSPVMNAGEIMKPNVDKEYEFGVKTSAGKVLLTAALYRIMQATEYVDPTTLIYKQDGLTRYQGLEFTATGSILPQWRVFGGAEFMQTEVLESPGNPASVGQSVTQVANRMIKLYTEYDISKVPGLTVTAGGFHRGTYPFWNDGDQEPAVTTFDLGGRYQTKAWGCPVTLSGNCANLFDKRYWIGSYLGDPRTYTVSAKIKFL